MKTVTYIENGTIKHAEYYTEVSKPVSSVVIINSYGAPQRIERDDVLDISNMVYR
jgi:hypothetical protein